MYVSAFNKTERSHRRPSRISIPSGEHHQSFVIRRIDLNLPHGQILKYWFCPLLPRELSKEQLHAIMMPWNARYTRAINQNNFEPRGDSCPQFISRNWTTTWIVVQILRGNRFTQKCKAFSIWYAFRSHCLKLSRRVVRSRSDDTGAQVVHLYGLWYQMHEFMPDPKNQQRSKLNQFHALLFGHGRKQKVVPGLSSRD